MRLSLRHPGPGSPPKGISAIPLLVFDANSEFEDPDSLSGKLAATSEGAVGREQPVAAMPSDEPADSPRLDDVAATAVPEPALIASECIAGQGPDFECRHSALAKFVMVY
jgi:hypothetical protein